MSNDETTLVAIHCSPLSDKSANPQIIPSAQLCTFYLKHGRCKFGSTCKFIHDQLSYNNISRKVVKSSQQSRSKKKFQIGQFCKFGAYHNPEQCLSSVDHRRFSEQFNTLGLTDVSEPVQSGSSDTNSGLKSDVRSCYFFKKGFCKNGIHCKFHHQSVCIVDESFYSHPIPSKCMSVFEAQSNNFNQSIRNYVNPVESEIALSLCADTVSQSSRILQLREVELTQLKKRFPNHKVICAQGISTFVFTFHPSDPDWPFDVTSLEVEASFPDSYPQQICRISVLKTSDNMPYILIRFINNSIKEWLTKKNNESITSGRTELFFRPFLKWFDKNLENLFILGLRKVKQDLKAKEAGIEFISIEKLFVLEGAPKYSLQCNQEVKSEINLAEMEFSMKNNPKSNLELKNDMSKQLIPELSTSLDKTINMSNSTKIMLSGFELTQNVASMLCTKVLSILQCSRCKTRFNAAMACKRMSSYQCAKCHKRMSAMFEAAILHQFSTVLGFLSISDCQVVDINIVECAFLIDCLNCMKQMAVNGIHYGQKFSTWCIFCNEKLAILIGGVRVIATKSSYATSGKFSSLPLKKEKKFRNPVIQEGEPLPDFGTCKHYKKSYRWLRFPCCGKVFPCDVCHNDKETDHEMKFASRMICGFCAKEQPYTKEKPCIGCSVSMTKKSGSHWEGGKGCRNKIHMNKVDKQKYSGVSKTISRKAQGEKVKKKI